MRWAWIRPAITPSSCAQDRAASSAGESNPTMGSFPIARSAKGSVLSRKAASTSNNAGTAGTNYLLGVATTFGKSLDWIVRGDGH